MIHKKLWSKLSTSKRDAIISILIVTIIYTLILWVNLSEALIDWFKKYEYLQLDEVPFLLLLMALGLSWFSGRRVIELNKEINLKIAAESKTIELLMENKSLTQHMLQIQETERLHLARDLHDDIGQYLLAIRLDAAALNFSVESNDKASTQKVYANRILDNAEHIQDISRSLIKRLRPAPTGVHGYGEAISILIQEWHEKNLHLELQLEFEEFTDDLTDQKNTTIYRFLQEALTNISKHANANKANIRLRKLTSGKTNEIVIDVSDDGIGLCEKFYSKGMGILGMRERIEAVHGVLFIKENSPHGTILSAIIPVEPQ